MSIVCELSATPLSVAADRSKSASRVRLDSLDGIRGLAAFYVMLGHSYLLATYDGDAPSASLSHAFLVATRALDYSHFAVAIFIVLSGCCLMLPVARSRGTTLAGGLWGFAKRRARRILPPYYAALIGVIAMHLLATRLIPHSGQPGEDFSAGNIGSHFLLLHNLFPTFNKALNGPMWSVAMEWQIYFVFALLLLPVRRRFGMPICLALALAIGYAPFVLLPPGANLEWTCPWYFGLFAVGMAAAVVISSDSGRRVLIDKAGLIQAALVAMAIATIAAIFVCPQWLQIPHYWITDMWVGLFAALLICSLANGENRGRLLSVVARGLNSRPVKLLGAFSYSLYLVQAPILYQVHKFMDHRQASHYVQFVLIFTIAVPLCLCVAYAFHRVFERPFMMPSRSTNPTRAEGTKTQRAQRNFEFISAPSVPLRSLRKNSVATRVTIVV